MYVTLSKSKVAYFCDKKDTKRQTCWRYNNEKNVQKVYIESHEFKCRLFKKDDFYLRNIHVINLNANLTKRCIKVCNCS